MFKRYFSMFLCALMLIGSCYVTEAFAASGDIETEQTVTIGVSLASTNSQTGGLSKALLDAAARVLDVHLEYLVHGNTTEYIEQSAQFLIDAGCSGVVICGTGDTELAAILDTCEENEVYLAQALGAVAKDSGGLYERCLASKWYVGAVRCPEADAGLAAESDLGATYCEPLYAFMMIYQAVAGTFTDTENALTEISVHGIDLAEAENETYYQQYFTENLPYTEAELTSMGTMPIAELSEMAESLSLEEVRTRLGKTE